MAVISAPVLSSPPRDANGKQTYGGLEIQACNQVQALLKTGHDITLIAAKGSEVPKGANLIETVKPSFPRFDMEGKVYKYYKESIHEYDIILDNSWSHYAGSLAGEDVPILNIMHSPVTFNRAPSEGVSINLFGFAERGPVRIEGTWGSRTHLLQFD